MKYTKRNWIIALTALVLALAVVILAYPRGTPAMNMTARELMAYTLECLGVTDAVSEGSYTDDVVPDISGLIYYSPENDMEYIFNEDSGRLRRAALRSRFDTYVWDSEDDPSPAQRDQLALDYAQKLAQPYLIGQLRLDVSQECRISSNEDRTQRQTTYRYHYKEYCGDIPTGTGVYVEIRAQGDVMSGSLYVGDVFRPGLTGSYSPKNGTDFIPESEAQDLGFRQVSGKFLGIPYSLSTEMIAYDDSLAYEVTIEPNDHAEHTYWAIIDAYTGEVLEVLHCA